MASRPYPMRVRPVRASVPVHIAMLILAFVLAACSPDRLVGAGSLPSGIPDPGATKNRAGALSAYRGALVVFSGAFGGETPFNSSGTDGSYIATSGLLSDELQSADIGEPIGSGSSGSMLVDARQLPEYADPTVEPQASYRTTYSALQKARAQAREALGLLAAYAPDSTALAGHLQAVLGYTEVLEAELFCSGIPLSTVDYNGDYSLEPGSTTEAVYTHAIALFDSSLARTSDYPSTANLGRIGKARALLGLGRYAEAAQAVAAVPDGFQYLELYSNAGPSSSSWANFGYIGSGLTWFGSVADREGGTGLDYVTSGDPRTAATATGGTNQYGVTLYFPSKYTPTGDAQIVLADWIEARLIESEAALQSGNAESWLATLNHLRETAISPALPDTIDPGTREARVDLMFRERAFWLFLTGHRQGDMRRLIRQYQRDANAVYPIGQYQGGNGTYGSAVTAPIPASERAYNPKFTGCLNRGA
jgi:hypothetical protein